MIWVRELCCVGIGEFHLTTLAVFRRPRICQHSAFFAGNMRRFVFAFYTHLEFPFVLSENLLRRNVLPFPPPFVSLGSFCS